jgi:hypothetical protein
VQYKKRQDRPIDSIKTTWREVRKRAGLDQDVIPYTIRHTVATELRRRGVPEWEFRGALWVTAQAASQSAPRISSPITWALPSGRSMRIAQNYTPSRAPRSSSDHPLRAS